MKQKAYPFSVMLAMTALLITVDQVSKCLAQAFLSENDGIALLPGVFHLQYLENRGAAFGILGHMQWLFILFALAISIPGIVLLKRLSRMSAHYRLLQLAVSLLTAGALGNLIDRLFRHYVIDFLYFKLIDFPIFNVADICVCLGCGALVLLLLFFYNDEDYDRIRGQKTHSDWLEEIRDTIEKEKGKK
ncbi:MAG: signal peptidase II [Lachnospiraceae bacterium]|nr:signal peptidase II [Lachnospiraceae bacterium]